MDENVIFNNPKEQDPQNQTPGNVTEQPVSPLASPPETPISDTPQSQEDPTIQTTDVPNEPPPDRPRGGIIKKIIFGFVALIIVIIVIVLLLPKGDSNKKAKLVWWGLWEDSRVMESLISDFHRQYPNITVEYIKQDPKSYKDKLLTRIKNGTGPDIFRFHNTWVPMLTDVLLPLPSSVITAAEFKKSFYPVMQKDLSLNGGIYAIPLEADSLALYVNMEIFDKAGVKPPDNWDDFVKAAKKLTVKSDGKIKTAGAALGTYGNITHAPDILSLLFVQQGVDMNKFPTTGSKKKTDVLDFYNQFAVGEQNVWDSTLDESILAFSRGNLAMYIGYSWDFFRIQALSKNLNFKIYPLPQLPGRNATIASYWVEGASVRSKNQQASLLFMKYLSKKETAQKFYSTIAKNRAFGEPYARRDLAESLKDNKNVYPFVSNLNNAYSSFFASDTNDGEGGINFLSNTYLENTVNSMVNDNSSSETSLETLDAGITQVFQKYGIR